MSNDLFYQRIKMLCDIKRAKDDCDFDINSFAYSEALAIKYNIRLSDYENDPNGLEQAIEEYEYMHLKERLNYDRQSYWARIAWK